MVLPANDEGEQRKPLCHYGRDKLASEEHLMHERHEDGFPATVIMLDQTSSDRWDIMAPWGTVNLAPLQKVADGGVVELPDFGMETPHHVHGYDVAQVFVPVAQGGCRPREDCDPWPPALPIAWNEGPPAMPLRSELTRARQE